MADAPKEVSKGAAKEAGRDPRQANPLVMLLVFVVLGAVGWYIIDHLHDDTKMQDCIMAGRKNCAPVDDTAPR